MKRTLSSYLEEFRNRTRKSRYGIQPCLVKDGKPHPVAFLCPGGSYRNVCSFVEGIPYARKLNKMGIHAIIVFYRVREDARYPHPQEDLARAIREAQRHAEEWKLDMTAYSVWGSSAGGHLAASFGTDSMGYGNYGLPRPGAMVLVYPVVTMGEETHRESRRHHLGSNPSPEAIAAASVQYHITENYPPTYLWWGAADTSVDPENSRLLRSALEEAGIECLCREFPDTPHGVGLGEGLPCEGWLEEAVDFWLAHR